MNLGSSTEGRSLRSGESTAVCSSKPLEQEDQDPLFPKKIFTMEQLRKGVATVQPKSTHVQYLKGLGHEKSMDTARRGAVALHVIGTSYPHLT